MSHLNRRGFMKTLLATAASATPAGVDFSERIAWLSPQTGTASASTNLENGDQQLRLSPVGAPLAFQNFVRVGNEWKPDRKSTRLNSSHLVISYAVFCLKKKKKKYNNKRAKE